MKKRYLFTLSDEAVSALDYCAEQLSSGRKPNRSATVEKAILDQADHVHKQEARKQRR